MNDLKQILNNNILDLRLLLNNVNKFSKRPKLLRLMLKKVCTVWSQGSEERMIQALLVIVKALNRNPDFFGVCTRSMYLIYVKNSKFIYGNSIATNNLMRKGLLEVYSLQLDEAYKHAFVFIRQLAIGVRKALIHTSKEEIRSVYNWQFLCSLKFWCEFVSRHAPSNDLINSLIHPLTQVILGAARLSSGNRWIPLRFHFVECLHLLAGVDRNLRNLEDRTTKKEVTSPTLLVPSLPLLLDIFNLFDFNKRAGAASRVPMDFRLMLHFSVSQRKETACMDAVAAWLHDYLTEALCLYAHSVAFPEYAAAALSEIRIFLKSCTVASFTRNFKSLLNKATEHIDFVKKKRSVIKSLLDTAKIINLESLLGQPDSPLLGYYLMHRQVRVQELAFLSERFKHEGEEHMKAEDGFVEDEDGPMAKKTSKMVKGHAPTADDEESAQSETDSDASYDIDDGITVTHVSRSGQKSKRTKEEEMVSDSDDNFDLDEALNEDDKDDGDAWEMGDEDELKDFRIDDFDDSGSVEEIGKNRKRKGRRQGLMLRDEDLAIKSKKVDDEEQDTGVEPMDVDMDSLSSEKSGGDNLPSKVVQTKKRGRIGKNIPNARGKRKSEARKKVNPHNISMGKKNRKITSHGNGGKRSRVGDG